MFGIVPGLWSSVAVSSGNGDPFYADVALLLHFDGANGSNVIVDNGPHHYNASHYGITGALLSNAQSVFNNSSISFTGGGGSGLRYQDQAPFNIGLLDFTIEFFVRFNDTGAQRFVMGHSDAVGTGSTQSVPFQRTAANAIQASIIRSNVTTAATLGSGNNSVANATWYYVALTREEELIKLFMGEPGGNIALMDSANTVTTVNINNPSSPLGIGCLGDVSGATLNGFMEEFRFTLNEARDVANIGVPTAPFPDS